MAAGLLAILHAFSGATAAYGIFHPALRAVACLGLFAGISGVWVMERWGLWLVVAAAMAFVGLDLYFGAFRAVEVLVPLAALGLLPFRRRFH
jgi:hypothetical protein